MRFVPPVPLAIRSVLALAACGAVAGCPNETPIGEKVNRPPVVTISNPEDGTEFSELDQIDFVGVVDDADGLDDIASLVWASDQLPDPLATLDDAPPDVYGYTYVARALPAGTHAVTLTIVDKGGLQAVASIAVVVTPQDVLPTADILVPVPGATFDPGEDIQLAGSASDPNEPPEGLVATWSYSTGGGARTDIDTTHPSASGSIESTWTGAPIGQHTLYLVVRDADGNEDEESIAVIVRDPNADDQDQDGFTVLAGDCDDNDAEQNPGAHEVCDGKDNDCNGIVDDKDLDFDQHVDLYCTMYPGPLPADDCDDEHGTVFPGAAEQADDLDNDCNGSVDDGLSEFDNDGDCFCTALNCTGSINPYCAPYLAPGDCDDTDASLHDRDDDLDGASPCDGDCDDGDPALNVLDDDGDGQTSCAGDCDDADAAVSGEDGDADGASSCAGDCDDGDALLNILDADGDGASSCAGDCNDGSASLNLRDIDGDGWNTCEGDCNDADPLLVPVDGDGDGATSCEGDCDDDDPALNVDDADLDGFSSCSADCDDGDPVLTPADVDLDGTSSCDGDCDDQSAVLNVNDADGDGASSCGGDCNDASTAMNVNDIDGDGYSTCEGDCNDLSVVVSPADNDGDGWSTCQGDCNDGDDTLDPADVDVDGWSTCEGDCDDANQFAHPTAAEVPYNGIDDDCVGGDERDVDDDGYESTAVGGDDCDDADAAVNPGATEACNGINDDCDLKTDENGATGCTLYYKDSDGDDHGTGVSRCQCGPNTTTGWTATVNDDCYDSNADANPDQTLSFYPDRGDGSWDYDCDGLEEKSDNRTALYDCHVEVIVFPPSVTCYYTNGWETAAPACGTTENWSSNCQFTLSTLFCSPLTNVPIDQECE